ncbi:MAG: hypothetical protein JEZ02_19090 [Desulfatibacillum sp.]|nr:hypothetical protein [Desulfatibacillum sp.]
MKKLAIIAMVLMVIPVSALARMDSMSEDSMGVIHGQVGITIDFETRLTSSYLAITDSNGGTGYASTGTLTLDGLSVGGAGASNMVVTGLKLDVGTTGTKSALIIGLPVITGQVQVDAVRIGTNEQLGNSLGAITWGNINYAATTCTVYPH